jgi:hypothetical protein
MIHAVAYSLLSDKYKEWEGVIEFYSNKQLEFKDLEGL